MSPRNSLVPFLISLSSLGAGLFVASAHPVAPVLATLLFIGFFMLFVWQPRLGLFSIPLFLPALNFSPWTGWLMVDEFDLLVLAVLAAGYFQMLRVGFRLKHMSAFLLLLATVVLLVALGAHELAARDLDWFSGYATPLNSFRLGKSLLWSVLLLPLFALAGQNASPNKAATDFFLACVLGSVWVVLAVCWERDFFPGLLDFSTPYRTVALFWEMHQGGAALDAFLVLVAPLLVWAWRATTSQTLRLALGAFVLAFVYVCLTTFSRGVLGAIAGSLILLSALLTWRRVKGGQATPVFHPASVLMLFLVSLEVALVLGSATFMNKRLAASEHDFAGRLQHWEQGIGLLKTPKDWLLGIGLGKLPSRLTKGEAGPALPGSYFLQQDAAQRTMVIAGPDGTIDANNDWKLGGLYALSQRVELISGQRYKFSMDTHSEQAVQMLVQVCAQHLLYPARCQGRRIGLRAGGWQHWESKLSGYAFKTGAWQSVGRGVFLLSVLTPGANVEIANLQLSAGGGNLDLLRNSQFLDDGAGWFPAVRSYFLPWHIDNLYLEILIETGLAGLFGFLALIFLIVRRLVKSYRQGHPLAAYFLSSIAGLMALGLLVSVLDMPRVATLFGLFLLCAWHCQQQPGSVPPGQLPST